jgi:hypothetical protein
MLESSRFVRLIGANFSLLDHVLQLEFANERVLTLVLARKLAWETDDFEVRPFEDNANGVIRKALRDPHVVLSIVGVYKTADSRFARHVDELLHKHACFGVSESSL